MANEGQEERFEHEDSTQVRDLRIGAYVKFLRAAQTERSEGIETNDGLVRTAEAEAALVASTAVRQAAELMDEALDADSESDYVRARTTFIELVQSEIDDDR